MLDGPYKVNGQGSHKRAHRWRDISSLKLGEYVVVVGGGDVRMV